MEGDLNVQTENSLSMKIKLNEGRTTNQKEF